MLKENRISPESKVYRWNGLMPFLAGAALAALGGYGLIFPGNWKSGPTLARRVYGGCLLLGAGFLLSQRGARLDRQARTVTTWWGFRFPLFRRVRSLDPFEWVTVADETHVHAHGGSISYPVRLHGSGKDVQIAGAWSFDQSWLLAKEAAEFLELKLWDATSGRPLERSALETPLHQRLGREPALSPLPPPPGAKSQVQTNDYGLTAAVPATGIRWLHVVFGLVLPPVLGLALRYQHHLDQSAQFARDPWFWCLTACFAILLVAGGVLGATLSEQVTVSKSGVQLVRRSWFGRKDLSIPLAEVLQIDVVKRPINYTAPPRLTSSHHVIEIRGVRSIVGFGSGLTVDELRWLVRCMQDGLARYGR